MARDAVAPFERDLAAVAAVALMATACVERECDSNGLDSIGQTVTGRGNVVAIFADELEFCCSDGFLAIADAAPVAAAQCTIRFESIAANASRCRSLAATY